MILIGMNVINYSGVIHDADEMLLLLAEDPGPRTGKPEEGLDRLPHNMSREEPYEARFFSVVLNSDTGNPVQVDTSRIITVERTDAIAWAQAVWQENPACGFTGEFRFRKMQEGETVRILFLDCGRKLDSFRRFLWAGVGISLAGYVVVFLIVALLSNRVVRPLAESYEKQKRFITDAGHEIRTPLTVIGADLDLLEMETDTNEWLEDIRRQTKRLTELTNDLVCLARMEESADTMSMMEFPISDVVSEEAASYQAMAQAYKKDFSCCIQPMLALRGNEKSIRRLVSILLDNAWKYSPEGGRIRLTVQRQGKYVVLAAANTTKDPVKKEELAQLFERFYREDRSRNSQSGGYGIGLSVAKAIAAAHGGRISGSAEDRNTLCITVRLPG